MGKKDKKGEDATAAANPAPAKDNRKPTLDGGIHFDSSEATIDKATKQVNLQFVNKPWTRDAWERARPWLLEQRQKLESQGWAPIDGLRTELFVLKRNAPAGSFTDDGSVYIRVPKKFIDFTRSGKGSADDAGADEEGGDAKKKKSSRLSKKKENAPSYELNDPLVWRLKIENAESDDPARVPSVVLDVHEAMENIMYIVMMLQPGMLQLHAARKNVVQPGTKQSATRDDAGTPTVRHTAMIASSESYTRVLPPAFWFKRNVEHIRKILSATGGEEEYNSMLSAAENVQRAVTRDIKDVEERTWEEKLGGGTAAAAAADSAGADGVADTAAPAKKGKKKVKDSAPAPEAAATAAA